MSAINLPRDILLQIFKQLTRNNVKECSKVCSAWYSAASVLLLENVGVYNRSAVSKFLQFCKEESETMRLNAIKTLYIGNYRQEALSREQIKDIIAHLPPRLSKLHINDSLIPMEELLSDDLFNDIVSHCNQLHTLEPKTQRRHNLCILLLWKFRHVLSHLSLNDFSEKAFEEYGGFVEYICGFPQLEELSVNKFQTTWELKHLLSLFERLSGLRSVETEFNINVPDNTIKNYLETKTQDEQEKLLQKLAKLENFDVTVPSISQELLTCLEYLTGLKNLSLTECDAGDWNPSLFYDKLLDLLCTLKSFNIFIRRVMPRDDIEEDFATIVNKFYHQMNDDAICVDGELTLYLPSREDMGSHMWSDDDDEEMRDESKRFELLLDSVFVDENTVKRSMQLQLGTVNPISDDLVLDNVKTLQIISETMSNRNIPLRIFFITDKLDHLPAVTKITLNVPMEKETHFPEDLETKYYRPGALDGLADCLPLFPDLTSLEIHYLIGVYGESLVPGLPGHYYTMANYNEKESHIRLENLAVNTLRLNLSSEVYFQPEKLFIINVHCKRNGNQQLYVTYNQYLQVTKVNEEEVDALTNGKECVRVFMTVEYIKNFVLVMEDNREKIDVEVSFNFI